MWQILDGLYLGDRFDAHDKQLLLGLGITHIVNCAWEIPCWHRNDFRYLNLKLQDPDELPAETIEKFCKFIDRGLEKGCVLVHCAVGVNRSPAVILGYLMYQGHTLDDALEWLREGVGESPNGFIPPDPMFLEGLELYFEDRDE